MPNAQAIRTHVDLFREVSVIEGSQSRDQNNLFGPDWHRI